MDDVQDEAGQRVEIGEAARRLGISADGVRKRLKRGQLAGGKGDDGRWYVLFRADSSPVLDGESSLDESPGLLVDTLDRLLDRLDERDKRIETLERERFELAGRLGYLQAQIEESRERVRLLEAPKEAPAPTRRPRWQFWKH